MAQGKLIVSTGAARQNKPASPAHARRRRRPLGQRLVLAIIGIAIVLLALGGWAAQALRLAR
jgi:di/tricarboxylate transporter